MSKQLPLIEETLANPRHLPNPEICRTRYLLYGLGFTRCLVEDPDVCEFAERSPLGVYCEHPDRRKFDHTQEPVQEFLDEIAAEAKK